MRVKPAYWLLPLALWMILWMPEAQGGSWGGTQDRWSKDSVDFAMMNSSQPMYNFGVGTTYKVEVGNPATVKNRTLVIRRVHDAHHADSTQDSVKMYLYFSMGDTGTVYGYVLKKNWLEGDETAVTADSCEVTWDSAIALANASGTCTKTDWATNGALGSGDRQTAVACSVRIAPSEPAGYKTFRIAGTHLTEDFFDYGLVLEMGTTAVTYGSITFYGDDAQTADSTKRPYFEGWEHGAGGGTSSLKIGTTKIGTVKLGP